MKDDKQNKESENTELGDKQNKESENTELDDKQLEQTAGGAGRLIPGHHYTFDERIVEGRP